MTRERLQKILAAAGFGSRRGCEEMIAEGRGDVNGAIAEIGMSADPAVDRIRIDGRRLPARPQARTFALYKPRGVVSSLSPQGDRSTVRDLLPYPGRFYPIGRLDMDSEGLILLTNDGELKRRLELPQTGWERRYRVRAYGRISEQRLESLRKGITVCRRCGRRPEWPP